MKKQILKYSLIFFTLATSFFFWFAIDRAINVPESSNWAVPIIWFTLLFLFFCLDIVLIREAYILGLLFVFSLALSFVFVFSFWHAGAVLLGAALVFLASRRIKADLNLYIKINLWRILKMGRKIIILGLVIVITSQYYLAIKNSDSGRIFFDFNADKISEMLIVKILPRINSDFRDLSDKNITVDEYLLNKFKENPSQEGESFSDLKTQINQNAGSGEISFEEKEAKLLAAGRKNLSDFSGREIQGSEKMYDVLSEIIEKKINENFGPKEMDKNYAEFIPMIMAAFLFLAILSIGFFLCPFETMLVVIIFAVLRKLKLANVVKVPVEAERVE